MQKTKNAILIGLLTIIPIWITWLVLKFVWELVVDAGEPLVLGAAKFARPLIPSIVDWLSLPLIKNTISLIVVLALLYVIGRLAMNIIGQRIIRRADRLYRTTNHSSGRPVDR